MRKGRQPGVRLQPAGRLGYFQGGLRKGKERFGQVWGSPPHCHPSPPAKPGGTERLSGSAGQRFVSHARSKKDNVAVTLLHYIQESVHLLHTQTYTCAHPASRCSRNEPLEGSRTARRSKQQVALRHFGALSRNLSAVFLGRTTRTVWLLLSSSTTARVFVDRGGAGCGGGFLRVGHKASRDTEAASHRCCSRMAFVDMS